MPKESIHLDEYYLKFIQDNRLLCLVDGEHYPPVTKWTIKELEEQGGNVVGLVFLGGTEKVENAVGELEQSGMDYKIFVGDGEGIPFETISDSIEEISPDVVVDLSDEPIVDYGARFKIASEIMRKRLVYLGADFIFSPPRNCDVLKKPSVSVVGTGKRIGKTAVGITISQLLREEGFDPNVICMGRGGPSEPDFVDPNSIDISADKLIEVAEKGVHAASDYWEEALLGGAPTVGCRRCGGGMAGNPFASNVVEGASLTNDTPQDFVIMEGSGATFPPIKTDKRIVVVGAVQPLENIMGYFGRYRVSSSDLAIVTMCEEPIANEEKVNKIINGIRDINPDIEVLLTVFRPEPLGDIGGKNVFVATTAGESILPVIENHLEGEYDSNIVGISNNLSNRTLLRQDLSGGLEDCDVLLTEVKAASIDVAARVARDNDCEVVFLHNRPVLIGGTTDDFKEAILSVCEEARKEVGEK